MIAGMPPAKQNKGIPLVKRNTSLSTSSVSSAGSTFSIDGVQQIIDDRYIDPDGLRGYMAKNFEPGSWTVRVRLRFETHTCPISRLLESEPVNRQSETLLALHARLLLWNDRLGLTDNDIDQIGQS